MPDDYLHFDSITKAFPGVCALDNVSFGVAEGSVHALLGENGAGKSTLLKILSGVHAPDKGRLTLGGKPHVFHSTSHALHANVATIYQELNLVPEMSVAENLYLGHLPHRLGLVDRKQLMDATHAQLSALGENINPRSKVGSLPLAQRQMVEIAKALCRDARVLAFDEPTSSLSSREVDKLFDVIRELKRQGRVILYVSHRLGEIFRICDSATVLRDGRHIETFPTLKDVSPDALVSRMVGRSIEDIFHYNPRPIGDPALEVEGIIGPGLKKPVSFSVAKGEIVGFFGLVGAGRTELLKLIYCAVRPTRGSIRVNGKVLRFRSTSEAIRAGLVLCPEDRKKEGLIPIRSVMENVNLSGRRNFSTLGFLISERRERENAARYVEKLDIKTPSLTQLLLNLSGGNQQKVILARWLSEDLKVILLDEPTRGIDVGAKSEIYSIIYDLALQGIGVVVVSSELPEVLGICDRIIVMREGAMVASLDRTEATAEKLLQLALPDAGVME